MKFLFILSILLTINVFPVDWKNKKSSVTHVLNNENKMPDENEKKKEKKNEGGSPLEHLSEQDKQKIQEILNQSVKKRKKLQAQEEENKKDQPSLKRIFRIMTQKMGVEDAVDEYFDYWKHKWWDPNAGFFKFGVPTLFGLWLLYKWRFKEDPLGSLLKIKADEMITEREANGQISTAAGIAGVNTLQKIALSTASSEAVAKVLVGGLKTPVVAQSLSNLVINAIQKPELRPAIREFIHEATKGFSPWSLVRGRGCYPEYNK